MLLSGRRAGSAARTGRHGHRTRALVGRAQDRRPARAPWRDLAISRQPAAVGNLSALRARSSDRGLAQPAAVRQPAVRSRKRARRAGPLAVRTRAPRPSRLFASPEARRAPAVRVRAACARAITEKTRILGRSLAESHSL